MSGFPAGSGGEAAGCGQGAAGPGRPARICAGWRRGMSTAAADISSFTGAGDKGRASAVRAMLDAACGRSGCGAWLDAALPHCNRVVYHLSKALLTRQRWHVARTGMPVPPHLRLMWTSMPWALSLEQMSQRHNPSPFGQIVCLRCLRWPGVYAPCVMKLTMPCGGITGGIRSWLRKDGQHVDNAATV